MIYDDLISNPEQMVTNLFKALDLPLNQVSLAVQVMNKDSQNGILTGKVSSSVDMNCQQQERVNMVFKEKLDLPVSLNMSLENFKNLLFQGK